MEKTMLEHNHEVKQLTNDNDDDNELGVSRD